MPKRRSLSGIVPSLLQSLNNAMDSSRPTSPVSPTVPTSTGGTDSTGHSPNPSFSSMSTPSSPTMTTRFLLASSAKLKQRVRAHTTSTPTSPTSTSFLFPPPRVSHHEADQQQNFNVLPTGAGPAGSAPSPIPADVAEAETVVPRRERTSPPPSFLLDDDPFADLSGPPTPVDVPRTPIFGQGPSSASGSRDIAILSRPSIYPQPPPLGIPSTVQPSSPRSRTFSPVRPQPQPAYQRPAFKTRPSLPSLDTLARMNVVLTSRKPRKGKPGAKLPFEPWDNLDDISPATPTTTNPSASSSSLTSSQSTPSTLEQPAASTSTMPGLLASTPSIQLVLDPKKALAGAPIPLGHRPLLPSEIMNLGALSSVGVVYSQEPPPLMPPQADVHDVTSDDYFDFGQPIAVAADEELLTHVSNRLSVVPEVVDIPPSPVDEDANPRRTSAYMIEDPTRLSPETTFRSLALPIDPTRPKSQTSLDERIVAEAEGLHSLLFSTSPPSNSDLTPTTLTGAQSTHGLAADVEPAQGDHFLAAQDFVDSSRVLSDSDDSYQSYRDAYGYPYAYPGTHPYTPSLSPHLSNSTSLSLSRSLSSTSYSSLSMEDSEAEAEAELGRPADRGAPGQADDDQPHVDLTRHWQPNFPRTPADEESLEEFGGPKWPFGAAHVQPVANPDLLSPRRLSWSRSRSSSDGSRRHEEDPSIPLGFGFGYGPGEGVTWPPPASLISSPTTLPLHPSSSSAFLATHPRDRNHLITEQVALLGSSAASGNNSVPPSSLLFGTTTTCAVGNDASNGAESIVPAFGLDLDRERSTPTQPPPSQLESTSRRRNFLDLKVDVLDELEDMGLGTEFGFGEMADSAGDGSSRGGYRAASSAHVNANTSSYSALAPASYSAGPTSFGRGDDDEDEHHNGRRWKMPAMGHAAEGSRGRMAARRVEATSSVSDEDSRRPVMHHSRHYLPQSPPASAAQPLSPRGMRRTILPSSFASPPASASFRAHSGPVSTPASGSSSEEEEEQVSDDDDDDIPLARRIPGALTAQKSIRRKVKEENEARRRQRQLERERQATLRPGNDSFGMNMSSSHEAALAAQMQVSPQEQKRTRTQTLPGKVASPFSAEDLSRKLQNVQLGMITPVSGGFSQNVPSSRSRARSISRQDTPLSPVSPMAALPLRSKSIKNSSATTSHAPSSASSPPPVPSVALRPMRSFHRSKVSHGVDESSPVDAERKLGRSSTSVPRRSVDESHHRSQSLSRHHRHPSSVDAKGKPVPDELIPPLPAMPSQPSQDGKLLKPSPGITGKPSLDGAIDRSPRPNMNQLLPGKDKVGMAQQRVFVGDMQRFHTVEVGPATTAQDVVDMIEKEGALKGWVGTGGWMVFEVAQDFGMERPIRGYELISDVQASWLKDKTVNYFVLRLTPFALPLSRFAIPSSSPTHSGYVEWEYKRGKWSKRWLMLREHCIWISKRDNRRDETMLCALSNFDAYQITRSHRAPKPFAFSVKSTDNLSFFESAADYLHNFSCNEKDGKVWLEKILIARSYVLHQERQVLFQGKGAASANGTGASVSRSATMSRKSPGAANRPLQPLVAMNDNAVFEPGSLLGGRHL